MNPSLCQPHSWKSRSFFESELQQISEQCKVMHESKPEISELKEMLNTLEVIRGYWDEIIAPGLEMFSDKVDRVNEYLRATSNTLPSPLNPSQQSPPSPDHIETTTSNTESRDELFNQDDQPPKRLKRTREEAFDESQDNDDDDDDDNEKQSRSSSPKKPLLSNSNTNTPTDSPSKGDGEDPPAPAKNINKTTKYANSFRTLISELKQQTLAPDSIQQHLLVVRAPYDCNEEDRKEHFCNEWKKFKNIGLHQIYLHNCELLALDLKQIKKDMKSNEKLEKWLQYKELFCLGWAYSLIGYAKLLKRFPKFRQVRHETRSSDLVRWHTKIGMWLNDPSQDSDLKRRLRLD